MCKLLASPSNYVDRCVCNKNENIYLTHYARVENKSQFQLDV
jgi:hypothetical protein